MNNSKLLLNMDFFLYVLTQPALSLLTRNITNIIRSYLHNEDREDGQQTCHEVKCMN